MIKNKSQNGKSIDDYFKISEKTDNDNNMVIVMMMIIKQK